MKQLVAAALVLTTSLTWGQVPAFDQVDPSALLVVYNTNDTDDNGNGIPDSEELAMYYQQKRGVPQSNMLPLSISTNQTYYYHMPGWENFWDEMVTPIKARIFALGQTKIKYILLCDKIPYELNLTDKLTYTPSYHNRRSLDNSLVTLNFMGSRVNPWYPQFWVFNPFFEDTPLDGNDQGSFNGDSVKVSGTNIYLVSRIMTESIEMNKNIVDMSLYGEKYIHTDPGYYNGLAYVDNRYGDYPNSVLQNTYPHNALGGFADWDSNACYLKIIFADFDWEVKHEPNDIEIGEPLAVFSDSTSGVTAPNAMLYGGWYNYNKYHDPFWWMPGSIASDLNSNSAAKIRQGFSGGTFLAGSFARGLTAGTGVIIEPYLTGHSRADILHLYMLNGYNFVEAAYHAEPGLRWMGIVLGDPLYRPFYPNKVAVADTGIIPEQITFDFVDTTETHIKLDYFVTEDLPEVVKAQLLWGTSASYTDTVHFDRIWMAHHKFELTGLNGTDTYHFKLCTEDPVGNSWCSGDITFNTSGTTGLLAAAMHAPHEVCEPDTVTFYNTSSGSYSSKWYVNGAFVDSTEHLTHAFPGNGMYAVKLVVDNGSVRDSVNETITVTPIPVTDFVFSTNLSTLSFTETGLGAAEYLWDFGTGDTSHEPSPMYVYDSLGTYTVCLTTTNDCGQDSMCQQVNITALGIPANISQASMEIAPNPSNGRTAITLNVLQGGQYSIAFYDMLGRRMSSMNASLRSGKNKLIIEPNFGGGTYMVILSSQGLQLAHSRMTVID